MCLCLGEDDLVVSNHRLPTTIRQTFLTVHTLGHLEFGQLVHTPHFIHCWRHHKVRAIAALMFYLHTSDSLSIASLHLEKVCLLQPLQL